MKPRLGMLELPPIVGIGLVLLLFPDPRTDAGPGDIVARLSRGPARVQDIADPFDVSLNTVSKHIKVLERAGLVRRKIRGREHICHLRATPLRLVSDFVEEYEPFWSDRLDAMESLLRATEQGDGA